MRISWAGPHMRCVRSADSSSDSMTTQGLDRVTHSRTIERNGYLKAVNGSMLSGSMTQPEGVRCSVASRERWRPMSSRGSSQGASAAALRADVHGAVLVAIEAGSGQVGVDHECPHIVSDLRRCISGDVPRLHPGKLLIRGFGVQVPGGAPRLTCEDASRCSLTGEPWGPIC
jgi:hypothetical protein